MLAPGAGAERPPAETPNPLAQYSWSPGNATGWLSYEKRSIATKQAFAPVQVRRSAPTGSIGTLTPSLVNSVTVTSIRCFVVSQRTPTSRLASTR
ncbi:MAG: hypothetical protein ACRDMK_09300 [Gaiellaceae bacterium]